MTTSPHAHTLRSLPLQGALAESGQPLARREQSIGLSPSGLGPVGAEPAWGGPAPSRIDEIETLVAQAPVTASPEVFQQLGAITRMLHDTLQQLGVMPRLQIAAEGLPDARSRLNYIATKTAQAAEKVLDSVDHAKSEHQQIAAETRRLAASLTADPVRAVASGAVMNFVGDVEARTRRIDHHLTDIMLAQDFHDLTGQVVAKVVTLATDLEDSLLKLLVQVVPPEQRAKVDTSALQGPVVDAKGRADVVTSQTEVDDLLASLGF